MVTIRIESRVMIMQQLPIKIGEQRGTSMSSLWGMATVTKVSRVDTDILHGYMFRECHENGYETGGILPVRTGKIG